MNCFFFAFWQKRFHGYRLVTVIERKIQKDYFTQFLIGGKKSSKCPSCHFRGYVHKLS